MLDSIKIEKLKTMLQDQQIPTTTIETVFQQCQGDVALTIAKLKDIFPEISINTAVPQQTNVALQNAPVLNPVSKPKAKPKHIVKDKHYTQQRQDAQQFAVLRNQYFAIALEAYMRGDAKMAKELSTKGKKADEMMRESNLQAANQIFSTNNTKNTLYHVDMHGLHVAEVSQMLHVTYYRHSKYSSKNYCKCTSTMYSD